MKNLFLSLFLFGFILTGNAQINSFMTKSDLFKVLKHIQDTQAKVIDGEKDDSPGMFNYLEELRKETISTMPKRANAAYQKLHKLSEDPMNAQWMILMEDILQMDKEVTNFYNNRTIEELKLRYLALAVFQCYKYDDRLPEASGIVEMVRNSVLTGKPIAELDSYFSKVKLIEFFDGNQMGKMSKEKIDSLEPVWDRWKAANDKVVRAFDPVEASLPIVTEDGLNRALQYLAEYYRVKYRLWRFNDDVAEITAHIAAGDRKVDSIQLPVPKNIHLEL